MSERKKVVVIGGGFAGIQLIRNLDEAQFDVVLIDKINHHQFQPLFYQVATSQIEPSSISFPLRNIFRNKPNVRIRMGTVLRVDSVAKKVETTIGFFDYDLLVVAIGCTTNFYGNTNIAANALTLKSTSDAIAIRNHILTIFENVLASPEEDKERLLNFVIVGAGPTGVELAGAFAEIKRNVLPKDYRYIDFSQMKVIVIEGSSHTLNNMSPNARKASEEYLKELGVIIQKETFVKDYDGKLLTLSSGETLHTSTVIWAAGVTGNRIAGFEAESLAPGNRLRVDRYNKVIHTEVIYALGDIAYMETAQYPKGHPQVANVAVNQAKLLAKNLNGLANSKKQREYEYEDLGSMATIGQHKAVVDLPFVRFKGYFAWIVWMFLHLMLILSVKNKLIIFINWAWSYVTKNSSLRLILGPTKTTNVT
jgi:NADH dehydrogenase